MKKIYIVTLVLYAVSLSSCMTMQRDIAIPFEQSEEEVVSAEMEARLATADAQSLQRDNIVNISPACTYIIQNIERTVTHLQPDKSITAHLTAIEGRAYLLMGDKEQAGICLEKAGKKNSGDIEVIILANRLGLLKDLDEQIVRYDNNELLILERAIDAYSDGRYADASSSFDIAFLSLKPFYRNAYQCLRNTSWMLKDTAAEDVQFAKLLRVNELTLLQMMEITQYATNLLDIYTGGRKLTGQRLYTVVTKAGLMNSISATDGNETACTKQLSADMTVSRILCARFLWNLNMSGRENKTAATKYSKFYRSKKPAVSPVPDVPPDSADFDAVLGTVENELMILPDGLNFNPSGGVPGTEFNISVKKIK